MNKHYIKQILTIVLLSLLSLSASAREVVIPEGTKIVDSDSGYRGDTTITSIVIPNSVTEIGWYAFSGCTSLTSVEIPNSVTWIDSAAFSHCISLTSVEIPNSVMYLSGFSDCTGLTSIVIPNSVTEIGLGAFTGCTSLTSVEIPNSVMYLSGFSDCTGLTSVEIPNSVTEIGAVAFFGCTGLTSVEIPNSVTEIGWYAFSDCTALTSVEIPNSVTFIDYEAFSYCTNLSRVVCYAVEPPDCYSYYPYYRVFSDETLKGTLYVPAKSIDAYKSSKLWGQFKTILPIEETEVPTVTIDETIRVCEHDLPIMWRGHEIYGDTVLSYNDTLWYMSLSMHAPVVIEMYDTISCGASYKDFGFTIKNPVSGVYTDSLSTAEGCDSVVVLHLEVNGELVIPEGTKEISYTDGYAYDKCITSVKIPNSVTEIGKDAFLGCTGLTSVEIPNSVTYLSGFGGCTGLTSVEIPNSVTEIGEDAFYDCTGLTSVEIPNSVTYLSGFGGCTGLTSVEIPNSVTEIGEGAFYGCTGLTSVEIPNSVTEIGYGAFPGCTGLTSVEIPNSVTKIWEYAFQGCTGLTSVEIPNSVTKIGEFAFSRCTNLSRVVCYAVEPPAYYISYYNYYNYVFSDETLKGTLYVPAKSIDAYKSSELWGQFKTILPIEGSELPTVTIDETIRVCEHDLPIMWRGHEIYGDTVLAYNDTLWYMSLSMHAPVVIEMYDTISCGASYKDFGFTIKNPVSGVYTDSLSTAEGCDSVVVLHLEVNGELVIPEGTKAISYKDGYHGNKCITTVKIPNSVTEIGRFAFEDCSGLTSVEIPSSVTSIGGAAFSGCSGLTSIEVDPKNTSYASQGGTLYNKEMTALICVPARVKGSFEIPNSVTSIGQYAFDGCSGLTSVVIPNSVTEIGWYAFYGCTGLTSVEIPNSVTEIGTYAFAGCTSLSKVVCYAVEPPATNEVFSEETILYVPSQSINSYKTDKYWGQFKTILPIEGSELPTVTIDETIRVCEHDLPIMWRGHEIYGDTVLSYNDTLWYMNLSLQRPVVIEKYDTVFCGASYKDYGFAIKDPVSGVYTDTLSTSAGCDSIVVLHLEVNGELVIPEGTKEITYEDGYAYDKCITSVKIPNSVTVIESGAFSRCTGLTSVEIPNSVTSIGYEVFSGCTGLKSVVISNSVTEIRDSTFADCYNLTNVVIPNSVTYLSGFSGCTGLVNIEIPNSVTWIGYFAFRGCTSLTNVVIPNSVTYLSGFSDCTGLVNIEIPNSVTKIGDYAFYGCTGLTSVEIPNSVTSIDNGAFYGCTNLSRVVCYAVEPPAYDSHYSLFSKETLSDTLYVPAKSLSAYKQDVDWGQFKTILPIEGSELPTVTFDEIIPVCENDLPINWRNHWIDGDTILTISSKSGVDTLFHISLEIHSTFGVTDTLRLEQGERYEWFHWMITEAGVYTDTALTAMGCDSIVTLYVYYVEPADTIPTEADTLYYQGTMAEWCANPVVSASLKAVVIEGQIYDKNTKSLVLPEGVATIHGKAFALCPNIRTLVLPSTLVAISDSAFKSCISLASVTCYAPEPPVAMASTFGNYNGYLYIPCDYQSDYDIHVCWGTFKHVDCIAAESTVVEDVEVDPSYDSADISWPKVEDVKGYSIEIYLNGKVLLSLRFNANGQLERIDFSLGNGSVNPAPASMGSLTTLKSAIEGFRFSVSGLEEATTYRYTLKVLGDMDKVIETHSGKFTTLEKPSDGVEDIDSSKDDFIVFAQNGLISVVSEEAAPVLIYNLQGQCLFSHQGSCTFRAPCAGVYVVRCGERTVKLILNYEL